MPISVGQPRKIYRGGVENADPQVKELRCAAANFRPGMVVTDSAGDFALPAAAAGSYIYVLNAPLHQDPLTYVYALDEVAYAYIPRSRDVYLARLTAGTYASDAPLTPNGTGGLRLAAPGDAAAEPPVFAEPVVAYVWSKYGEPVVVPAGGGLTDIRIK